jgi:hypothetical protein
VARQLALLPRRQVRRDLPGLVFDQAPQARKLGTASRTSGSLGILDALPQVLKRGQKLGCRRASHAL